MADKNTVFQQKLTLNVRGTLLDLSKPKIMGILNLTPDSFYDGGRNNSLENALRKTEQLVSEGADLIDLGAYSSRPGAEHISEEVEFERMIPVIRAIAKEFPKALLSVDTFRSGIARAAIGEGADMINDISAGAMDDAMFRTIAELKVPYILMHMRGTPQTMASETNYTDLIVELAQYFAEKIHKLKELGVKDLIIDPGFGFAKTLEQNYELLGKLEHLKITGHPVLAALSRKSMVYKLLETDAEHALNGTTVANTIALMNGANILRVHDVLAAKEAVKIVEQVASSIKRI
ncbi:dihydropteroate synthase [Daejeonella rubra]|uniref:Dihydropteroate synthase n=1 Tax=Daejeonella rubra TaxID=990371 RepID=A0A1G9SY82_9SPHI|nr:dihydropteroate synthase [Daejeonella rubra]SDM40372.1 dihydropteroate synthase [Daejeonella rubra]